MWILYFYAMYALLSIYIAFHDLDDKQGNKIKIAHLKIT